MASGKPVALIALGNPYVLRNFGAVTAYAGIAAFPVNTMLIAAIFTVLGTVSAFTWVLFGTGLKNLVNDPRSVRIFNLVMAGLLAASLIPVFLE